MADEKSVPPLAAVTSIKKTGSRWDLGWEKAEYNRDQIYGRTTDDRGHSNQLRIKLMPEDYNAIVSFVMGVDSPLPHRSVHEFIRDSIIHNLVYWTQKVGTYQPGVDNYLLDVIVADKVARRREASEWTRQLVKDIDHITREFTERNQVQQAIKDLVAIREDLGTSKEPHHAYVAKYIDEQIAELKLRSKKKT